jgi:superfamily II DNA/RNA helicase
LSLPLGVPDAAPTTFGDPLTFGDLGLPPDLVEVLAGRKITAPLPIQTSCIPDALAGRDISGRAPTGSGKTLAFCLPLATRLSKAKAYHPTALILAPTRELASQIADELRPLLKARHRRAHAFYGGVSFGAQIAALRSGVDVVVACPGRLEDLIQQGQVQLGDVRTVVIDEADRMADMGFLPAVRRLVDQTSPQRQTLLFSATLDGDIDVLVHRYQHNPARHEVDLPFDEIPKATHQFHAVSREDRAARCAELITNAGPTVVFVRTKHGADRLARQLERSGVPAVAIHGDRSQAQRDRALAAFRAGKAWALVATDVAARGIHVDGVAQVVHYDLPPDPKDYVHRSGRTARNGAEGTVVGLVTPEDRGAARVLVRQLPVSVELIGDHGAAPADGGVAGHRRPAGNPNRSRPSRPAGGSRQGASSRQAGIGRQPAAQAHTASRRPRAAR